MLLRTLTLPLAVLALVLALAGCGAPVAPQVEPTAAPSPAASPAARPIVIADISDEPTETIAEFQPLADYLATKLAPYGVGVGEVRVAPDMETMVRWLADGEVDLYFDSPYPAMVISDQSAAVPLVRRWKGGTAEYHTIFFARADSGLTALPDLRGRAIGLENGASTSGYLLPVAYLIEQGLSPVMLDGSNALAPTNEVGYVFTEDDENTVQWVLSGKLPAGVLDNQRFASLPPESRAQFTVLAETEQIARQIGLVRPGLAPELQAALKAALLEMDQTAEGRAALLTFEETARFDDFPATASLERMRQLYTIVRRQAEGAHERN